MSDTHDPTVNDIFADDDPPKRLNKGIRRMPLSNTSFPYIPSLARLCLAKVRALRSRLEGLSFLPEDIVISIVEGSTIDELKQIEIANPDAPALKFWDRFWQPRCEKSMQPVVVLEKPAAMSWSGMVVLEDVPRGGSTSLRSFHRASGTRAPGETSPSGAAIRPGSTIMKTRPPQLKVSNPAIQKARKLPPFKAAPRR